MDIYRIFVFPVILREKAIGEVSVYTHPGDERGGQVHLYIKPKWRKKWLSRGAAKEILTNLMRLAGEHKISMLYSTALRAVSPRLLEFFGFTEYNRKQPKTYYYLEVK